MVLALMHVDEPLKCILGTKRLMFILEPCLRPQESSPGAQKIIMAPI
jgi:hypothetical protein